jgi:hypothetical protein
LGNKALRSYSQPLNLSTHDSRKWMTTEEDLEWVGVRLNRLRHYSLLQPWMVQNLSPVDQRSYDAGFLGTNPAGTFQAKPGLIEG